LQFSRTVEGFCNDLSQFFKVTEGHNHILEMSACGDLENPIWL
jgi:hypothetical protein